MEDVNFRETIQPYDKKKNQNGNGGRRPWFLHRQIPCKSSSSISLKSKLNTTLKELETVQSLLEKERAEHEKTKKDLQNIKQTAQSFDKS